MTEQISPQLKKTLFLPLLLFILLIYGCIGDDIIDDRVEEEIRITSTKDTMAVGETFQFVAKYFNEIGQEEAISVMWTSSDQSIIQISEAGLAEAFKEGQSIIKAIVTTSGGTEISDEISLIVTDEGGSNEEPNFKTGTINTTSSYLLEGTFSLTATGSGLVLELNEDFKATTALPGLYVYLGNNKNSISSALEISKVTQFNGQHSYDISGAGINDYEFVLFWCKPFNVKVGEGTFNN